MTMTKAYYGEVFLVLIKVGFPLRHREGIEVWKCQTLFINQQSGWLDGAKDDNEDKKENAEEADE